MLAIINSFLLVFVSEMGDKTQLLALLLTMRYKKPWTILSGVFIATLLNHGLASWGGDWVSKQVPHHILSLTLGLTFIFFAAWILIPDKEEKLEEKNKFGPFVTTIIAFFFTEMGDKTQLATVALGAKYANVLLVTVGTTLGMLASNALAIFCGNKLLTKIPMNYIRIIACVIFLFFGAAILIGY